MTSNALQFIDTANTQLEASTMLDGLRLQHGYIGGRILAPSPSKPGWRVQVFLQDEPDMSMDDLACVGLRRVLILPSQRAMLGISH